MATSSVNLASLELLQFLMPAAGLPQVDSFGTERVHYVAGLMESDTSRTCTQACGMQSLVATGDAAFLLTGRDHTADRTRARQVPAAGTAG